MTYGTLVYATKAWWSTALLPGLISTAFTSLASVTPVGITKTWYWSSMLPSCTKGSGMPNTRSGSPIWLSSGYDGNPGLSAGLPSGMPSATQALMRSFWAWVKNRSPRKEL